MEEMVAPIPGAAFDERTSELESLELPPLDLVWIRSWFAGEQWSRNPVFATCHKFFYGSIVRLYLRREERFELCAESQFGEGYLEDPEYFVQDREAFLLLTMNSGGSASFWTHRVFWLGNAYADGCAEFGIREVPIERPLEILSWLLRPDQHSEPYRTSVAVENDRLRFDFSIWNAGEHNNFPTGGSVSGTFRLVVDPAGLPTGFVVDDWTFDQDPG